MNLERVIFGFFILLALTLNVVSLAIGALVANIASAAILIGDTLMSRR